nr:hypothetical protein [Alkalihalobacillus trypoxylicola]
MPWQNGMTPMPGQQGMMPFQPQNMMRNRQQRFHSNGTPYKLAQPMQPKEQLNHYNEQDDYED